MALPLIQIRRDKITGYLLDLTSPDGASKAKFFLGRGFSLDSLGFFVVALGNHASTHWPGRTIDSEYGTKHVLVGAMACPDGSSARVRTVWMLTPDGTTANFVTAYPA